MAEPSLREALIGLLRRSHGDMMDVVQVADQAQWNQLAVDNWETVREQASTQFQSICPGHKQDEDDDEMGRNVFINAGLMADQATSQALLQALGQEAMSQPPQAQPQQTQQPPANQQAPLQQTGNVLEGFGSKLWGFIKKALPFLAVAGISIAAARYFAPTDMDTTNEFTIQAEPYSPPGATGETEN